MSSALLYLCVAGGGAAGACARFFISRALCAGGCGLWPWHTLAVNLAGCALAGVLAGYIALRSPAYAMYFLALVQTGFLGGFTTFSAFGTETHGMAERGAIWPAVAYIAVSVIGGLGCFAAARATVRALWP